MNIQTLSARYHRWFFILNGPLIFLSWTFSLLMCLALWKYCIGIGPLFIAKKNQMSDHSARKPISRTSIVNIVYLYVWGTVISTEACRGCRTLQAKWLRSQKHHLFAIQHSKVISCLHLRFCSLCFQSNEIWNDKKKYIHTTDGKIDELLQSNNLSNWLTCSN